MGTNTLHHPFLVPCCTCLLWVMSCQCPHSWCSGLGILNPCFFIPFCRASRTDQPDPDCSAQAYSIALIHPGSPAEKMVRQAIFVVASAAWHRQLISNEGNYNGDWG